MVCRRILMGVITLVVGGVVHADLMPGNIGRADLLPQMMDVSPRDTVCASSYSGFANLDFLCEGAVVETRTGIEQEAEPVSPLVLSSEDGSVNLCFYGLLGLGLLRGATWAKLLSLSAVCACCQNGSLYQTDHGFVLSRDCPARAPVYFCASADGRAENATVGYGQKTVLVLLCQSQCAPTGEFLRGPPGLV